MACNISDRISAVNKLLKKIEHERGYWVPAVKGEMEAELKLLEAEQTSANNKSKRLNIHLKNTPKHSKNIRSNDKNTPEFNKLPRHVDGVKSMTYAGVGSREKTPDSVKSNMTDIAKKLEEKGYKLQTGKTFGNKEEGADAAFSKGTTNKELFAPESIQVGGTEWKVAQELHPAWSRVIKNWNGNPKSYKGTGVAKLMARNTNQIFGANLDTPVDFVLFYAKETDNPLRPEGGTGQTVEMARRKGIPTINMADADWKGQLKTLLKKLKTAHHYSFESVIDAIDEINYGEYGGWYGKEDVEIELEQVIPKKGLKATLEALNAHYGENNFTKAKDLLNVVRDKRMTLNDFNKLNQQWIDKQKSSNSSSTTGPVNKQTHESVNSNSQTKPSTNKKNVIITTANWTRDTAKDNPDYVYIFGDNTDDRINTHYIPNKTQAVIRGLPNAFGIDTKKSRSEQFTDKDYNKYVRYLNKVFNTLNEQKANGVKFIVSKNGIATGKAELPPRLHNELAKKFNKFVGKDLIFPKNIKKISAANLSAEQDFAKLSNTTKILFLKNNKNIKSSIAIDDSTATSSFNPLSNTLTFTSDTIKDSATVAHEFIHSLTIRVTTKAVAQYLSNNSLKTIADLANIISTKEIPKKFKHLEFADKATLHRELKNNREIHELIYLKKILRGEYKPKSSISKEQRFKAELIAILGSSSKFRSLLLATAETHKERNIRVFMHRILETIKNVKSIIRSILAEDKELLKNVNMPLYRRVLQLIDDSLVEHKDDIPKPDKTDPVMEKSDNITAGNFLQSVTDTTDTSYLASTAVTAKGKTMKVMFNMEGSYMGNLSDVVSITNADDNMSRPLFYTEEQLKILLNKTFSKGFYEVLTQIARYKAQMDLNINPQENQNKIFSLIYKVKRSNNLFTPIKADGVLENKLSKAFKKYSTDLEKKLDSNSDYTIVESKDMFIDYITGEGPAGSFNYDKNAIVLPDYSSLDEIGRFRISQVYNIDPNNVEAFFKISDSYLNAERVITRLHEKIHGAVYTFMQKNPTHPSTLKLKTLHEKLINAGIAGLDANDSYWKTNKDEMIAEMLSVPELVDKGSKIKLKDVDKSMYKDLMLGDQNIIQYLNSIVNEVIGVVPSSITVTDTYATEKSNEGGNEEEDATLTEDQKVSYNGIADMLTSKSDHVYMLEGLGGTGKSFTAGKAIKAYVDKDRAVDIIGVATAHTAKDIIGDFLDSSLKDNDIEAKRLVTVQLVQQLAEANANKSKTIVVLDEISMIDPVTMDLILAQASKYVKLLIVGDRAQLRHIISAKPLLIYGNVVYINNNKVPIKENNDGTVSLVGQSKYGLLDNLKFEVTKGIKGNEIDIAKSPLLLKSTIFRKESSSSINGHVLKEVKRLDTSSKDGEKLLELINNFRYSKVVDNVNEDNSNDLKTQYMEAVSKLKSPGTTVDIHENKEELINSFRDGTASAFAGSNSTVNAINTRLGSKFAAEIGDDAVNMYAQKGMFEEQTVKAYVNFGYSEKMNDPINVDSGNVITNNTNLTLRNIRSISNRGNRENGKSISKVPVGEKFVAGIPLDGNDVITGMRINWTAVVQNADKEFIDLITVADGTTKDGVVHSDIVLISQPKLEAYLSPTKKLNDTAQLIMKYATVLVYDGNGVREESPKQAEKTYIQVKDVMDVLGNIRPTYAMTVHKSQGVSVPTAILVDDLQGNSFWSWGQKLELAYVATSRSGGKLGYVKNFKQELLDTLDAKAEYKANDDIITEVRSAGNELEPSTIDLIMQNIDEYDIPHDDNNNEC